MRNFDSVGRISSILTNNLLRDIWNENIFSLDFSNMYIPDYKPEHCQKFYLYHLTAGSSVRSLALSEEENQIFVGVGHTITVWDQAALEKKPFIIEYEKGKFQVSFLAHLSNNRIASIFRSNKNKDRFIIWSLDKKQEPELDISCPKKETIHSLKSLPNQNLVVGTGSGKIYILSLDNKKWEELTNSDSKHSSAVIFFTILPNGHLLSVSDNRVFKIWDLKNKEYKQKIRIDCGGKILSCVLLPDENFACTTGGKDIYIVNIKGKILATLSEHSKAVKSIVLLPNGRLVSTSKEDATLKFWNLHTHRCEGTIDCGDSITKLMLLPTGQLVCGTVSGVMFMQFPQRRLELTDIRPVLKALEKNSSVKSLNLSGISINHEDIDTIIQLLSQNTSLMALDIRNTNIAGNNLQKLVEAVKAHPRLYFFEFSNDGSFPHLTSQERESLYQVLVAKRKKLCGVSSTWLNERFPKLNNILTRTNDYINRYRKLTEKWEGTYLEFKEIKTELDAAIVDSINYFQLEKHSPLTLNPFEFDIKVTQCVLAKIKDKSPSSVINFAHHAQSLLQNYATQTDGITKVILISAHNPSGELNKLRNTLSEVAHVVGSLAMPQNIGKLDSIIKNIGSVASQLKEMNEKNLLSDIEILSEITFKQVSKLTGIDLNDINNMEIKLREIENSGFSFESLGKGLDVLGPILSFSGVPPRLVNQMVTIGKSAVTIGTSISQIAAGAAIAGPIGAIAGAIGAIFNLFSGPSQEEKIFEELGKQMQQGFEGLSEQIEKSTKSLAKLFCEGLNQLAIGISKQFETLHKKLDVYHKRTEQLFDVLGKITIESHLESMKKLEELGEAIKKLIDKNDDGIKTLYEVKVKIDNLHDDIKTLFEASAVTSYESLETKALKSFPTNCLHEKRFLWTDANDHCDQLAITYATKGSVSQLFLEATYKVDEESIRRAVKNHGLERSINLLAKYKDISKVHLCNFKFWARATQDYLQFTDMCIFFMVFYNVNKVDPESFKIFIQKRLSNIEEIKRKGEEVRTFLLELRRDDNFFVELCNSYVNSVNELLDKIRTKDVLNSKDMENELKAIETAYEILVIYLSLAFNKDFAENGVLVDYLNKMFWTRSEFEVLIDPKFFTKENKRDLCETLDKYVINEIKKLNILIHEKVKKAKTMQQTEYAIVDMIMSDLQTSEIKLNRLKTKYCDYLPAQHLPFFKPPKTKEKNPIIHTLDAEEGRGQKNRSQEDTESLASGSGQKVKRATHVKDKAKVAIDSDEGRKKLMRN